MYNLKNSIGQFRLLAHLEGLSFLILVFIAMPLKYFANMPKAVSIVGGIHGFLFVCYLVFLIYLWNERKWKFSKVFLLGIASVLPFGPFIADKRLLQYEK
jgi:integral membrane protein